MPKSVTELARIYPAVWPGKELDVQPGDLKKFVPLGMGLVVPPVMMPWDKFEDALRRPNYYAFQGLTGHPLADAPITEPSGGTIYFDDLPEQADFVATLRLLGVPAHLQEYALFCAIAENPLEERYLVQLRIMPQQTVGYLFGADLTAVPDARTPQPQKLGDLLWSFLLQQQEQWGRGYSHELSGCLGGDGDWAKESLCFGLMVENDYHKIYRLWSRAWLVTK